MLPVSQAALISLLRSLAALAAFMVFYIFSGVFVLRYLTENGVVAVFWPPTGIALAALLIAGRRYIPAVFAASFLTSQFAGAKPVPGLLYAAINTVEGVIGWWLLTHWHKTDLSLTRARDYFQIFVCGGVIAPFVGALSGAITLCLAGLVPQDFWYNLQYWWMGDSLGVIVLTPLLLIWRRRPVGGYSAGQWFEAVLGFSTMVLVGQIVFAGFNIAGLNHYARGFILFIFITWSAVRFGRHATSLAIAIIIVQIMIGVMNGQGYFAHSDRAVTFGTVWLYIIAMALTGMALAIYIYEGRSLNRELLWARQQQEQVNSIARTGGWEFDVAENRIQFARETLRILELPESAELDLQTALSFVDVKVRERHVARGRLAIEQGIGWDVEFGLRTKTGRKLWVRSQAKPIMENGRVVRLIGALHDLTEARQARKALERSELEFKRLVETASEGVWTIDANGLTTFVNRRMAEMLGYQPEEMLGTSFLDYVAPELHQLSLEKLQRWKKGVSEVHESALRHRTGRTVWVMASTSPIRAEDGTVTGALAMMVDITERKAIEDQLRQSESRYRQFVESLVDAIVVHQSGFIVYANESAARLVGAASAQELIGRNAFDFVAPEYRELALARIRDLQAKGGHAPLIEEKFLRLDGTPVDVEVSASTTVYNGKPGILVVARDITDRKRAEEQIRYLGQHDSLTGLPNRALLADRLAQAIAVAERHQSIFALLFLDLDHFKKINDSYGHRTGDDFLKQVAGRLVGCVRAIDTVSRQGGDEFILLLSELAHPEDAGTVARKICEQLAEPFIAEGVYLHASVSIGIAVYPRDGATADELLRNADIAMYYAKNRGRNQYQFFSEELNRITRERLEMETALRKALSDGELYLAYQPQQNLQTGAIEGFEALLRWRHPSRGELAPQDFIPIAEESGQIARLGEWVLQTVLADMQQFDAAGFAGLRFAINLSAIELKQADFTARVQEFLAKSKLPPQRLEFELAESLLVHDSELAVRSIEQLSAMGLHFAIDDFGTGYSSLANLRKLRIGHLKIDRSFISDLERDADSKAIVRTVIALAQHLRLKVIAEGVERQAQRDFLRNHGCELMQGYLLAPPLPLAEALAFLERTVR